MWLKKYTEVIVTRSQDTIIGTDFSTALTDTNGLAPVARDLKWQTEIDRSNPIAKIRIYVKVMVDALATAMTPDTIAKIVKNISFERQGVGAAPGTTAKRGKLSVWNATGADTLARKWQTSKLDRNTNTALTGYAVDTAFVICYELDLADNQLVDPLYTITSCPVHLDAANPVLVVSFSGQSDMEASGGTAFKLRHLTAEVHIERIEMPSTVTEKIIADGGFLESDFISRDVTFSQNARQRVEIESPGEYSSLLLTTFTSSTARGVINDSSDLSFKLLQQNKTVREFTAAGQQAVNSESIVEGSSAPFSHVTHLDFVGDSLGNAENNLGSLLDTNLENQNGQKTILEFRGGSSTAALRWAGRRYLTPIGTRRFAA